MGTDKIDTTPEKKELPTIDVRLAEGTLYGFLLKVS
jgi:hypothetical protein